MKVLIIKAAARRTFFRRLPAFFGSLFSTHLLEKEASIRKKGDGGCVMSVEVASHNIKAAEKGDQKTPVRLAAASSSILSAAPGTIVT